jgi:Copper chaperone
MTEENTVTLRVEGMSCGHCIEAVTNRLTSFPGVKSVNVSLEKEQVVISGSELDPDFYARELNELGYTASVIS